MSNTDWIDARVNKPGTDFTGKSDIVFCLCTNGVVRVALWDSNSGFWYDPETAETFGNGKLQHKEL